MQEQIHDILQSLPYKLILSKAKNCEYRKVQILKKEKNIIYIGGKDTKDTRYG